MYCSVVEKQSKRKPWPSRIYRNPAWKPYYPGSDKLELSGDEIHRPVRPKWIFTIAESYRENGRVKKRQYHAFTLHFWAIIDCFVSRLKDGSEDPESIGYIKSDIYYGLERHFKDPEEQDRLYKLVEAKCEPIRTRVIAEYRQMDEYPIMLQNVDMVREREKGQGRKKASFESFRSFAFGGSEADSFNFNLGGLDRGLARQVIESGYRRMAQKLHPDAGGTDSAMQALNQIKEKMLESL